MTGDKFVFRQEKLPLCLGFSILPKALRFKSSAMGSPEYLFKNHVRDRLIGAQSVRRFLTTHP
jgi:hypothetical protein